MLLILSILNHPVSTKFFLLCIKIELWPLYIPAQRKRKRLMSTLASVDLPQGIEHFQKTVFAEGALDV
jgi:hypothetical protein